MWFNPAFLLFIRSVLQDTAKRAEYNKAFKLEQEKGKHNHDEIDLEDMVYNAEEGMYSYQCRCGGMIVCNENELLDEGREIFPCLSCSLWVKVVYEVEEEFFDAVIDA